jgi:RNA polymerase sigma-70 factor (ECF subfamily)
MSLGDAAIDEARRVWPQIALDPQVFAAHLQAKRGATPLTTRELRVADLYLACACARRDPVAIALFEAGYFDEIRNVCARFPSLSVSTDDIRQRLREKLFLADPPSVAGYGGQGDLRAWFRAAVLHFVLNITSREARETPTRDCFFEAILDASPSAEAAFLRRACRKEFEDAFAQAVTQLPDRERSLLRYTFNDKLTIDEVGAIFQVHRATAARWIQKAQLQLVESTRHALTARLGITPDEADSVVRGAMSSLGTTLFRYLT